MLKIKLPVAFEDGKQLYDAVLKLINETSPPLAKMIHDNWMFSPFSVVLPDQVNILEPTLEFVAKQWENVEVISELDYRECFQEENDRSVAFRFEKTFFIKMNICYPLPDPWNMVRSWKNRWNSLFPQRISLDLPILRQEKKKPNEEIEIRYANIVTHQAKISSYNPYICFSGRVRLRWAGSDDGLKQFMALARFAEFAGTGAKTTMGCGVTRIEPLEV